MTTQRLVLCPTAVLCLALGCSMPAPETPPTTEEQPKVEAPVSRPIAPAPRAKADHLPPPPVIAGLPNRPSKPWPELIVGKWLDTGRGFQGQRVLEFTRDGKCISRYSYPAAPGHPKGLEVSTRPYHLNGNVLFPASTFDDGFRVEESTTFIEFRTDNELVMYSISRSRCSPKVAKSHAIKRNVPVQVVLNEITEERSPGASYVRLKDK